MADGKNVCPHCGEWCDRLDELNSRIEKLESKISAMVKWLEVNQPDVFRRGIWDALNDDKAEK